MEHKMEKVHPKAAKKHHIKHAAHAYKKGGAVKGEMAEGDEVTHADEHEIKEAEGKKRGGKIMHKKHGGKVAHKAEGKKAMHRLDKKARGGKIMTPKSPMSGAAPTQMRPGFGENTLDKSDD